MHLADYKSADIPKFIGKISKSGDFLFGQFHIIARRITQKQRQTGRVRAVFLNHIQWIDGITQSLAHFPALRVAYQSVQINFFKRNIAQNISGHQNHSRHPEK